MIMRVLAVVVIVLAWAGVTGSFSVPNLLFGLIVALAALWIVGFQDDVTKPTRVRPLLAVRLAAMFVVELLKSGWRVAKIAVRRDIALKPAVIRYPLRLTRDLDITLLANLITLTPGTLTVDVSDDKRFLYVHCVDVDDEAAVIADIRDGFEKTIMETFP